MTYIEEFLDRNKHKSFCTNLMKYANSNKNEKLKCISSFYTHLVIDADIHDIDNIKYRIELLSLITQYELNGVDNFLEWLSSQMTCNEDETKEGDNKNES